MHNYYYYVILSQLHTCPAAPVTNTRFTFSLPAIFPLHTPFSFFYTTLLLLVLLLVLLLLSTLFFPFPFSLSSLFLFQNSQTPPTANAQHFPSLPLSLSPLPLLPLSKPFYPRGAVCGEYWISREKRFKEIREWEEIWTGGRVRQ